MYLLPLEHPSQPPPPSPCSGSSQSPELSSLCYAAISHWWSISPMLVYLCRCYALISSHPLLLPLGPPICSLCLCLYSCWRDRKRIHLVFLWPAAGSLTLSQLCILIPTDTWLSLPVLPQALQGSLSAGSQVDGGASSDFRATFQAVPRSTQCMPAKVLEPLFLHQHPARAPRAPNPSPSLQSTPLMLHVPTVSLFRQRMHWEAWVELRSWSTLCFGSS